MAEISVNIKSVTDHPFLLLVKEDILVEELIRKIREYMKVGERTRIRVIFKGRVLENNLVLKNIGFVDKCVAHITVTSEPTSQQHVINVNERVNSNNNNNEDDDDDDEIVNLENIDNLPVLRNGTFTEMLGGVIMGYIIGGVLLLWIFDYSLSFNARMGILTGVILRLIFSLLRQKVLPNAII